MHSSMRTIWICSQANEFIVDKINNFLNVFFFFQLFWIEFAFGTIDVPHFRIYIYEL